MSVILSTLFDALISKVLPKFGVPTNAIDVVKQTRDDSYDSLVKHTRVEPFCIVDNTLVNQSYTESVYQVSLNVLIAYYLQAVSLINVGHGIPPIKMLRRLSPEGGIQMAGERLAALSMPKLHTSVKTTVESFDIGMGSTEAYDRGSRGRGRPIQRDNNRNNNGGNNRNNNGGSPPPTTDAEINPDMKGGISKKVTVNEVKKSNVLIGKSLTIDFNSGETSAPITVNVRYDIIEVPPPLLVDYLSQGSPDSDLSTRIRQLRAGKLRFWRDFVFASDLLDEQKKLMLMDKSNLLKNIITRRGMGVVNAASGGGQNYGISSNCMIVNETTLRDAERLLKGDITNDRVRNAIFSTMSLLLLIVVDKEYERFTFYFRNKPMPTTVSAKMLKSAGGEKEDSLEVLAKALGTNRPVTF